jgi:hypothetical protein
MSGVFETKPMDHRANGGSSRHRGGHAPPEAKIEQESCFVDECDIIWQNGQ